MPKKITTIEELGEEMRAGFQNVRREVAALQHDVASAEKKVDLIEQRMAEIPTRSELGELLKKFYDAGVINTRLERIEKHLGLEIIHADL